MDVASSYGMSAPFQPSLWYHPWKRMVRVCTHHRSIVKKHVSCIPELSSHRRVPQHWVHAPRITCDGRGLEVLDELADAHQLARQAELLLSRLPWRNRGSGVVRAVQVPREEAREVLEGAEHFVATDWASC